MTKYFIIGLLFVSHCIFAIDGAIRICNKGGYLAKCYLQSRSSNFGFQSRRIDTGLFPIAQCTSMNISLDAVANRLECKALAFIGVYKRIFVQEFASPMYNYCYKTTGTTLDPRWSQTQC